MKKKEKWSFVVIFFGLFILWLAVYDVFSIVASVLERVCSIQNFASFTDTLWFRTIVMIVGTIILLHGAKLYKKSQDI